MGNGGRRAAQKKMAWRTHPSPSRQARLGEEEEKGPAVRMAASIRWGKRYSPAAANLGELGFGRGGAEKGGERAGEREKERKRSIEREEKSKE